jgi:hypothetical protein
MKATTAKPPFKTFKGRTLLFGAFVSELNQRQGVRIPAINLYIWDASNKKGIVKTDFSVH